MGDWLDGIFQAYRSGFRAFFLLAAVIWLPLGLLQGVLLKQLTDTFIGLMPTLETLGAEAFEARVLPGITAQMGNFIGFMVLAYLAGILLNVAGILLVSRHLHAETVPLGQALKRSGRPFLRSLAASLLLSVTLLLVDGGLAVVIFFSLGLNQGWLGWLAAVVLVVINLFLVIRWSLVNQAIVIEGTGVFQSIQRSYRLTSRHFWAILGRLLLYGIIAATISMGLSTTVSFGTGFLSLAGMATLLIAAQGLASLVRAAVAPLGWLGTTLIYYDLRVRKEGYDLEQRVASLEQEALAP